jgi:hypothetical protein
MLQDDSYWQQEREDKYSTGVEKPQAKTYFGNTLTLERIMSRNTIIDIIPLSQTFKSYLYNQYRPGIYIYIYISKV